MFRPTIGNVGAGVGFGDGICAGEGFGAGVGLMPFPCVGAGVGFGVGIAVFPPFSIFSALTFETALASSKGTVGFR